VTKKDFLDLLAPHFMEAKFLRNRKVISHQNSADKVIMYLDELNAGNNSDDILFTK
jgi:hypothetical protein